MRSRITPENVNSRSARNFVRKLQPLLANSRLNNNDAYKKLKSFEPEAKVLLEHKKHRHCVLIIARAYFRCGEFSDALALFELLVQTDSTNKEAQRFLAVLRDPHALKDLNADAIIKLQKDTTDEARDKDVLAVISAEASSLEEMIDNLHQTPYSHFDFGEALLTLGHLFFLKDKKFKAAKYYNAACIDLRKNKKPCASAKFHSAVCMQHGWGVAQDEKASASLMDELISDPNSLLTLAPLTQKHPLILKLQTLKLCSDEMVASIKEFENEYQKLRTRLSTSITATPSISGIEHKETSRSTPRKPVHELKETSGITESKISLPKVGTKKTAGFPQLQTQADTSQTHSALAVVSAAANASQSHFESPKKSSTTTTASLTLALQSSLSPGKLTQLQPYVDSPSPDFHSAAHQSMTHSSAPKYQAVSTTSPASAGAGGYSMPAVHTPSQPSPSSTLDYLYWYDKSSVLNTRVWDKKTGFIWNGHAFSDEYVEHEWTGHETGYVCWIHGKKDEFRWNDTHVIVYNGRAWETYARIYSKIYSTHLHTQHLQTSVPDSTPSQAVYAFPPQMRLDLYSSTAYTPISVSSVSARPDDKILFSMKSRAHNKDGGDYKFDTVSKELFAWSGKEHVLIDCKSENFPTKEVLDAIFPSSVSTHFYPSVSSSSDHITADRPASHFYHHSHAAFFQQEPFSSMSSGAPAPSRVSSHSTKTKRVSTP